MWAVVIGIAALSACGNPNTQVASTAESRGSSPTAENPAVPAQGSIADSLAFSAPQVGGGTINMTDYAGKPVLLWFWAPT
jgi:hypothetical protein